jgi:tetratricopeptide (TPR) repeat protein
MEHKLGELGSARTVPQAIGQWALVSGEFIADMRSTLVGGSYDDITRSLTIVDGDSFLSSVVPEIRDCLKGLLRQRLYCAQLAAGVLAVRADLAAARGAAIVAARNAFSAATALSPLLALPTAPDDDALTEAIDGRPRNPLSTIIDAYAQAGWPTGYVRDLTWVLLNEPTRQVHADTSIRVLFVDEDTGKGRVGRLRIELLPDGHGDIYPHPVRAPFGLSEDFRASIQEAAYVAHDLEAGLSGGLDIRWSLDWASDPPAVPRLKGRSLGAAFAAGMYCLLVEGRIPDPNIAISAELDAQTLVPVEGIEEKCAAANQWAVRRVIVAADQEFTRETPEEDAALCLHLASVQDAVDVLTGTLSDATQILTVVCLAVSQRSVDPNAPDAHELTTRIMQKYEAYTRRTPSGGILALFGTPSVHESDPQRAVFALEEAREELKVHGAICTAGVATGDATPGHMRFTTTEEADAVHSDAARLLRDAAPGQIILSPSTYRCVRDVCDVSPISTDTAPNDTPQALETVWRSTPRTPVPSYGGTTIVGRKRELRALMDAYEDALDGAGQIVTISGEAGIGKSRLVIELEERTRGQENDELWLWGHVQDLGESFARPYGPFVDAFDVLGERLTDRAQSQSPPVHEILQGMREREEIPEYEDGDSSQSLSAILGLTTVGHQNPEDERQRAYDAVRTFVLKLVEHQPIVMVLEDLHWADMLTTNMVATLAADTRKKPLMIICVYRPSATTEGHPVFIQAARRPEHHTHILVGALPYKEAERLLTELLPEDPRRKQLQDAILDKTGVEDGGRNPLLIHSLVGLLRDQGKIYQEAGSGRWRISDDIDSISLPEDIQLVVQARFGLLDDRVRFLLLDASAIGISFRRRLLQAIVRTEAGPTESLESIDAARFVQLEPGDRALGGEYSFYYALMHESIYRMIRPENVQRLHANIGAAIEKLYASNLEPHYEELARHYHRTLEHAKVIQYCTKAAAKVMEKGDPGQALTLASIAKERANENSPDDFDTHHSLCRILAWAHYWLDHPHEMLEIAKEGVRRVEEYYGATLTAIRRPEAAAAMEVLALAHLWSGTEYDLIQHEELSLVLMDFLRDLEYSPMLRTAYVRVVDYLTITRRRDVAREWIDHYETVARQQGDIAGIGRAISLRGALAGGSGKPSVAIKAYEEAIDLYQKSGDKKQEAQRQLYIGLRQRMIGELHKSKDALEKAIDMFDTQGREYQSASAYASQGTTLLCLGDTIGAREAYTTSGSIRARVAPSRQGWARYHLACVDLAEGRHDSAQNELIEACGLPYMYRPTRFRMGMSDQMALVLATLESTYESPEEFQEVCRQMLEAQKDIPQELLECQWYLAPTTPRTIGQRHTKEPFAQDPISTPWSWIDKEGDCSYHYDHGLHIRCANTRNLIPRNQTAPRVLRGCDGDFAMEASCESVDARPAIGGLLVWADERNYLGLRVGDHGPQSIALTGCIDGRDGTVGRGRLPTGVARLRVEKTGAIVRGLCTVDGQTWLGVGEAEMSAAEPLQIGLLGIGRINRTLYRGAFPEGTAIRFSPLGIWSP